MTKKTYMPHDTNVESAILGMTIMYEECLSRSMDELCEDYFFHPVSIAVFRAIKSLSEMSAEIDVLSVSERMRKMGVELEDGNLSYVASLVSNAPISSMYGTHKKPLLEYAQWRKLLSVADDIKRGSMEASAEISDVIEKAVETLSNAKRDDTEEIFFVPEAVDGVVAEIEIRAQRGRLAGIPTGFAEMDGLTGGWQGGRYYMIAARPKVGKSSLVAQIADFAASQVPTAIMSLEMTKNELIKLLLYQHASVDGNLEQTGKLTKYDIESIRNASLILKTKKLYIDDKARTMGAILQSVRRAKKDFLNKCAGELRVLIVDYIQFIRGDNRIKGRNYQLEDISRSLKEIAKELNLCVICLAQIGRGAEDNRDMRPMPSDLKDCAMESDVDALMLMYRDAYYKGNNDKNSVIHFVGNKKVLGNLVELNCFLNRHGPTGIIKLDFIPAYRKYIPWGAQLDLSGGDPF